MLVLTRKASQQIRIGENVVLTILQIKGNTVRVGIEAPREVRVIRGELRGLDAARPAVETAVTDESPAPQSDPSASSLRSSPRSSPPGSATPFVADFTPIRSSRRSAVGERRGLSLARR